MQPCNANAITISQVQNACLAQSSQKVNPRNSRQSFPLLFLKNQIQIQIKNFATVPKLVSDYF
jgi:hypothetical protein